MDRAHYEQMDRVERGILTLLNFANASRDDDVNSIIVSFYDVEVAKKDGALHHLKDDRLLSTFIEKMRGKKSLEDDSIDSELEEDNLEEENKGYLNRPFQ